MRRYYNKGSLVGGQVKLDKMGNNDGKISGEDFAVIRSQKMGGGMMKRPMYKAGSANPKAKSKTSMKQAKAGMESQKPVTKKVLKNVSKVAQKMFVPFGAVESGKKMASKIKDKFTKKKLMGGGRVKRAAGGPGLYANIKAKKDRIAAGSGEKMRKVGTKGAPTAQNFINAAKTAKKV